MQEYHNEAADDDIPLSNTIYYGHAAICSALTAVVAELRNLRETVESQKS
jgi:hypothetical protein